MRSELNGWPSIAARPEPLLSLGACEPAWLERALPALAAAAARAPLAGEDLLHLDVRSDNLCFVGDTVKLVDWNWAVRGDRRFDVAAWLPSLAAEGGPPPWEVVGPGYGEYAALLAGFWARQAPTPAPPGGSDVRELQRRLLTIALRWAARDLDLPAPDAH